MIDLLPINGGGTRVVRASQPDGHRVAVSSPIRPDLSRDSENNLAITLTLHSSPAHDSFGYPIESFEESGRDVGCEWDGVGDPSGYLTVRCRVTCK